MLLLHRQRLVRSGLRRDRRRDRDWSASAALAAAFVIYIIINYGVRGSYQMVYRLHAEERRAMMSERLGWLFVFFALYATYCVFWGVDCARGRRGAMDFFLAERGMPSWVFAAGGDRALLHRLGGDRASRDDFPRRLSRPRRSRSARSSFRSRARWSLSRQWMLSRRFGFVTPVEMYADYFGGPVDPASPASASRCFSPCRFSACRWRRPAI